MFESYINQPFKHSGRENSQVISVWVWVNVWCLNCLIYIYIDLYYQFVVVQSHSHFFPIQIVLDRTIVKSKVRVTNLTHAVLCCRHPRWIKFESPLEKESQFIANFPPTIKLSSSAPGGDPSFSLDLIFNMADTLRKVSQPDTGQNIGIYWWNICSWSPKVSNHGR